MIRRAGMFREGPKIGGQLGDFGLCDIKWNVNRILGTQDDQGVAAVLACIDNAFSAAFRR